MILKNIITMDNLTISDISHILEIAFFIKHKGISELLKGKIMASCFFEPSTRTRLSFETAMYKLGGQVIGFSDEHNLSLVKGESFHDTIKVVGDYADILVIRHPKEGSLQEATKITDKPVINAGNGSHEHPTQTLTDLFSIQESQGTLHDLNIIVAGDLLYARTIHSLILALCHFRCRLFLVPLSKLFLPDSLVEKLRNSNVVFSFHEQLDEVIQYADIIYLTRIQKERCANGQEAPERGVFLSPAMMSKFKPGLRILHPLPRNDELPLDFDNTSYAYYFNQAQNGVYVRQALLTILVGEKYRLENSILCNFFRDDINEHNLIRD